MSEQNIGELTLLLPVTWPDTVNYCPLTDTYCTAPNSPATRKATTHLICMHFNTLCKCPPLNGLLHRSAVTGKQIHALCKQVYHYTTRRDPFIFDLIQVSFLSVLLF